MLIYLFYQAVGVQGQIFPVTTQQQQQQQQQQRGSSTTAPAAGTNAPPVSCHVIHYQLLCTCIAQLIIVFAIAETCSIQPNVH